MNFDHVDPRLIELAEATSFRPIAMRICNMVTKSKTSLDELEYALSMDAVLSAKTLQVANSPFFSRGRKTESIAHALALIGIDSLRVIVLSAPIHDVYKSSLEVDKKLWGHALGVSLTASILARKTGLIDETTAAAAGLFHDSGKLLMRNAYAQQYIDMIDAMEGSSISFCEAEMNIFNITHATAGKLLAKSWNLPQDYSSVIAYHHQESNPSLDQREQTLIKIIAIADGIAFFFGIGLKRKLDIYKLHYRDIGMSEKSFDDLVWEVNDIYEEYVNSLSF